MIRKELSFGWHINLPSKKFITLTDSDGNVGVLYDGKDFGDPQTLLINISEMSANVTYIPHFIKQIEITTKKEIIIHLNDFVLEMDKSED